MLRMSHPPGRIADLLELKRQGCEVTCKPIFEIVPVDFTHRDYAYQAYVFLCRYGGTVNGESYSFRKCYARGCPNNLCPHVFQAVMIANRHLSRDYERLKAGGIKVAEQMFSLEDMMVKFDGVRSDDGPLLTIYDYIHIAGEGNDVRVEVMLEYLPAVEHFANYKNAQTFLNGEFDVRALGKTGTYQRCLACYSTKGEQEEKPQAVRIANQRLALLYLELDKVSFSTTRHFLNKNRFCPFGLRAKI